MDMQSTLKAHGCEALVSLMTTADMIKLANHDISWKYRVENSKLYIEEIQGLPVMAHEKSAVISDLLVKAITGKIAGFECPGLQVITETNRLRIIFRDESNPNVTTLDDIFFKFDAQQNICKAYQHYADAELENIVPIEHHTGIQALAALARDLYK